MSASSGGSNQNFMSMKKQMNLDLSGIQNRPLYSSRTIKSSEKDITVDQIEETKEFNTQPVVAAPT